MEKSFYFSHDLDSRSDIKIRRLLRDHGVAGYGVFWCIVEDLYSNNNKLPTDFAVFAFDLRTDEDLIRAVVEDYNLFDVSDGYFSSVSVGKRLEERQQKSAKAAASVARRWEKPAAAQAEKDTNVIRTEYERNTNVIRAGDGRNTIKERKGKERKGNSIVEYGAEAKNASTQTATEENSFLVVGSTDPVFVIPDDVIAELERSFPALDIRAEIRQVRAWCLTNAKNRKTRSGALRFLNSWLQRSQNSKPKNYENSQKSVAGAGKIGSRDDIVSAAAEWARASQSVDRQS